MQIPSLAQLQNETNFFRIFKKLVNLDDVWVVKVFKQFDLVVNSFKLVFRQKSFWNNFKSPVHFGGSVLHLSDLPVITIPD